MKTWLRLVLITMSVGGGFTGLVITLESLLHSQSYRAINIALIAGFLVLFGFVTASGLLFVHDPKRTRLLLIALSMQVPWISTPVFVYKFAAGFHAVVTIGSPRQAGNIGAYFGWEALLGSTFKVGWNGEIPWDIGINLGALLLIILLLRSARPTGPVSAQPTSKPTDAPLIDV